MALKQAMLPEFKEYAVQIIKNAKALSTALQTKGNASCPINTFWPPC